MSLSLCYNHSVKCEQVLTHTGVASYEASDEARDDAPGAHDRHEQRRLDRWRPLTNGVGREVSEDCCFPEVPHEAGEHIEKKCRILEDSERV